LDKTYLLTSEIQLSVEKSRGMFAYVLTEQLGQVEAQRFITLLLREPFDYTTWQRNLFEDKSIEEISKAAMKARELKRDKITT